MPTDPISPAARPRAGKPDRRRATPPAAPPAGRTYNGLRAEDRAAARRVRLIEAGIMLFGDQGLRGTTVRRICAAAGLTDRYFYESFDGLEALLGACYDSLLARLRQALLVAQEALSGRSVEARFNAGYDAWFAFIADAGTARIMLAEVLGVSPAMDARYEAGMRVFADDMTGPLREAGDGRLSADEAALIARALVGSVVQVAKMWSAGGYREPRATVVRSCVLVALGTVRALRLAAKAS